MEYIKSEEANEYGCKCIYFIIDENNSLKEELEGQASDSSDKIEFRYVYSLEEIENFNNSLVYHVAQATIASK